MPNTLEANCRRGRRLNAQMDRLNPYSRPRGFVYKARSLGKYEQWRQMQANSRLWRHVTEPVQDPLLKVCFLLNRQPARYLIVGGNALVAHGLLRTTGNVDILVEESEADYQRVIVALSQLEDHAAA